VRHADRARRTRHVYDHPRRLEFEDPVTAHTSDSRSEDLGGRLAGRRSIHAGAAYTRYRLHARKRGRGRDGRDSGHLLARPGGLDSSKRILGACGGRIPEASTLMFMPCCHRSPSARRAHRHATGSGEFLRSTALHVDDVQLSDAILSRVNRAVVRAFLLFASMACAGDGAKTEPRRATVTVPPSDAQPLCSGHVSGVTTPDGKPGPHISWDAYSSRESPGTLTESYLQSLGTEGHTKDHDCDSWRLPPAKPTAIIEVCPASASGPWSECHPPPREAASIVMTSSVAQ
jgi:hypothetical protein